MSAETENFCVLEVDISQIAYNLGMEKLMQVEGEWVYISCRRVHLFLKNH